MKRESFTQSGGHRSSAASAVGRGGKENLTLLVVAISIMIVFMVVPEGFDYEGVKNGMPTTGSAFSRLLWLIFLGLGVSRSFKNLAGAKKVLYANRFLIGIVVLSGLSYFWSIEPGVTMRRMVKILAITAVCLAFATNMRNPRSFQAALRPALTLLLVGSMIFVVTSPQYAIEQMDLFELAGAWRGLTTQKNGLGALASFGTLLWLHAWISGQVKQPMPIIGFIVSAACLVNSRSSTSLMATIFASVLMLLLMRSPGSMKRYMPYIVGTFISILLLYSLAVLHVVSGLDFLLTPITSIIGKDLTFSGRTAIWDIVNAHIQYQPWLVVTEGTGLALCRSSPSFEMTTKLLFYPSEAHNGYLDIINDLGWVGEFLLLGFIITYLRQSLRLYGYDRAQGAINLGVLFQQMIANLSGIHVVQCARRAVCCGYSGSSVSES